MAKQVALIRASFFIDSKAFAHFSDWEDLLSRFYVGHGLLMKRVNILGGGGAEPVYVLEDIEMVKPLKIKDKKKKQVNVSGK